MIDFVWAVRSPGPHLTAEDPHHGQWIVLAAFEIEGHNAQTSSIEKDADSLSSAALLGPPECDRWAPTVATILFTVGPDGTEPWSPHGSPITWDRLPTKAEKNIKRHRRTLEAAVLGMQRRVAIEILLDHELAAQVPAWVERCRDRAKIMRATVGDG